MSQLSALFTTTLVISMVLTQAARLGPVSARGESLIRTQHEEDVKAQNIEVVVDSYEGVQGKEELLMSTVSSSKKITLKSSDGEVFEVDEAVALESPTIKHMIEEDSADNEIHLPNVRSKILAKVIEYCKKHVEAQSTNPEERTSDDDLRAWDAEFIKVDQDTLFGLFLDSDYLKIKSLRDLTSQTIGDMMKGKTPEEIRKTFNIKDSCTPAEEEELPRENKWAFD
ncbi:hypothetical protein FH972_007012 [Carpinus fangiana]|uniref:SKP1-like protein n=1 Tax=Carpinus fangiana TaxID=176857 RepID=A0A5N6QU09_9ROSI|nr:hypothetical protein FH972_007012 [Carpinus fangiana]